MARLAVLFLLALLAGPCSPLPPDLGPQERQASLAGIGVGARVTRGPTWTYGEQDGGSGAEGTVIELRQWQSGRNVTEDTIAVRVRWDNGLVNAYRWNVQGTIRDVSVVGYRPVRAGEEAPPAHEGIAAYYSRQIATPALAAQLLELKEAMGGKGWVRMKGWTLPPPDATASSSAGAAAAPPHSSSKLSAPRGASISSPTAVDPCSMPWEGVSCMDGTVVGLDLSRVGLSGPIPASMLCGKGVGRALQSLTLANNQLSGAIPDGLCACAALRFLDLSNNELEGALPACVGRLTGLETLSLAGNKLSGPVPAEWARLAGGAVSDRGRGRDGRDGSVALGDVSAQQGPRGVTITRPRHMPATAAPAGGAGSGPTSPPQGDGLKLLYLHNNPDLAGQIPAPLLHSDQLRITCTGTGLDCRAAAGHGPRM